MYCTIYTFILHMYIIIYHYHDHNERDICSMGPILRQKGPD